ncbi:aromatic aminobenezylarsenical efflux permease ArsG family transporter [candidate division KSB1 bacterium]
MEFLISGALASIWLGILTSISPCPLATNIAAITFISNKVQSTKSVLLSGTMYTLGRMLAYLLIAVIVITGLLAIPKISHFLQKYLNMLLGPVLIIAGMFLLKLLYLPFSMSVMNSKANKYAEKGDIISSAILGLMFGLSFCPVTAALFFGSLIPLAVSYNSSILLPALYGIGTGLPVFLFAVIISVSAQSVNTFFKKVTQIELWARKITGALFIGIGIYLSLDHIFELF